MELLKERRAGVLLHPTSLPGGACGSLGPEAFRFVDFLADAGCAVWQMLPLGPTHEDRSPYHALSVHAGDPCLIDLPALAEAGWLSAAALVDSEEVAERQRCLAAAQRGFAAGAAATDRAAYETFVSRSPWLEDYALFAVLRTYHAGQPWWRWEAPLRDRDPAALNSARRTFAAELDRVRFEQFVFQQQWQSLQRHARRRGVLLFGDMPIFVAHDSADVWSGRDQFALDAEGQPLVVAGVPPDYFSATGQRWGNPLYRWERMQADGFRWWIARLATELGRFDVIRVDHFRGFEACWEIPAHEPTAANGRWVKVPGQALFGRLLEHFGTLPLVAEDLGVITPEVERLRDRYGLPGMRVLQFAFDGDARNPYLPFRHEANAVVYTGTHDNDTTLAWFEALPADRQLAVVEYLGYPHEPMPWPVIRAALASVARLAVIPMQDVLGLGHGQRMNTPGTAQGNWRWRFDWAQLAPDLVERLRRMVKLYGRATDSGLRTAD